MKNVLLFLKNFFIQSKHRYLQMISLFSVSLKKITLFDLTRTFPYLFFSEDLVKKI